ncbi:MAG TPA: DUF6475 domain-containing protein [Gammaproteobacteria bacterium]|nr:DUF6475 domain-containing protein [Gammaproteobacteria bacterium]
MRNEEMPEFVELLTALSLSYGQSLNEFMIERYWLTLERFEFAEVKKALYACTTQNPDKGQFMPQATEILRHIEGSTEIQALKAWALVLKIVRQVSSYDSLVFDDPILHRVIDDMGGWISLCETTLDEMKWKGYTFQKLYAAYVLQPPAHFPKKLLGRAAWQNGLHGYQEPPPVVVGDKEKAKKVFELGTDRHTLVHRDVLLLENNTPALENSASPESLPCPEKKD